MTTSESNPSLTDGSGPVPSEADHPLRLQVEAGHDHGVLRGAWWPHSRDLDVEIRQLVDGFPRSVGTPSRILYSPPDWDTLPRRVAIARGYIKVGHFPRDDTHAVVIKTVNRETFSLVVIPSDFTPEQGARALDAAAVGSGTTTAGELLDAAAAPARA